MQKDYKTRHDWVGKVIDWELCKKLKFDHTSKRYMHKPESVLGIKSQKILTFFDIQTIHLLLAKRPDQVIVKKIKKTTNQKTPQNKKKKNNNNKKNRTPPHQKKKKEPVE